MLIALISSPPPAIGFFLLPASVLVFAYLAALSLALPRDPLVLAVTSVLLFNACRTIPAQFARQDFEPGTKRVAIVTLALLLALLIWKNDPIWCQRVFTITLTLKALFLAHAIWRAPEDLDPLGAPSAGPDWFREDWARWKVVSLGLTVLINETAIRYASPAEWIVVMAIAPALIYCMFFWTLTALAWSRDP